MDRKFHFGRATEEFPQAEKVSLPKTIESELISEKPESPLSKITERFKVAGLSAEEIGRYRQAVNAFFERGTVAETGSNSFSPQSYYFSPRVTFSTGLPTIPDLLRGTPLKPRLGREGKRTLAEAPINGQEVLKKFTPSEAGEAKRTNISPVERLLVKMNRFSYALHEPSHINQGLAIGDRLNRLKDKFHVEDLMDTDKEIQFVKEMGLDITPLDRPGWIDRSVVAATVNEEGEKDIENIGGRRGVNYWAMWIVINNEATMDALQDNAVKDTVLAHPEMVMWVHNMLAMQMEALRTLKQNLMQRTEVMDKIEIYQLLGAYYDLENSIGFMDRFYFAPFTSSDEAEEFLLHKVKKTSDRELSGEIAHVAAFDRTDVLNELTDVNKLLLLHKEQVKYGGKDPGSRLTTYTFPSGKTFFKKIPGVDSPEARTSPITVAGSHNAALVVECAVQKGFESSDVKKFFGDLQEALDESDNAKITEMKKDLRDSWGLDMSEDDLREMYGIADHIYFDRNGESYYYKAFLRKKVIEKLDTSAPNQINDLIRSTFFEIKLTRKNFELLSGFYAGDYDSEDRSNEAESGWRMRPWDEITQDAKLGIMNIDMTQLNQAAMGKIRDIYEQLSAGNQLDYEDLIRVMAEIRRQQVEAR